MPTTLRDEHFGSVDDALNWINPHHERVWIKNEDPEETKLLQDIEVVCHQERIALFICRAADLPNGWKRYD